MTQKEFWNCVEFGSVDGNRVCYQLLRRQTDPETSQLAAAEIEPKLTGLRARFVKRVQLYRDTYGRWPTAQEAAGGVESLRKRAAECVRGKWLRIGQNRICSVTGNQAQTYEVVE